MEKVYSYEELVALYGQIIQDRVRKNLERKNAEIFSNISSICAALNVEEYGWKNSPEGFANWVERMAQEGIFPESAKNELLRLWKSHNDADEEWKAIYYACRNMVRPNFYKSNLSY